MQHGSHHSRHLLLRSRWSGLSVTSPTIPGMAFTLTVEKHRSRTGVQWAFRATCSV